MSYKVMACYVLQAYSLLLEYLYRVILKYTRFFHKGMTPLKSFIYLFLIFFRTRKNRKIPSEVIF